jgi:acetyl-CoA carboxylase biotin carboxylase subunit
LALCSEADRDLPYVAEADEFAVLGPPPPAASYLNRQAVLDAAVAAGADAVHPGWGFLSEDAEFARLAAARGLVFIGPSPHWLGVMGDKPVARRVMAEEGFPAAPATGELVGTLEERAAAAAALGFPLMIKPAGGGGGIGMAAVEAPEKLLKALEAAESLALRGFGRGAVYAERLLRRPRHVEFQIVANGRGGNFHLFERDCSVQRRRQKVLEEAGAPALDRAELDLTARKAAEALGRLGYDHLGTVETLHDPQVGFSFLEVNPRLQVEHAVTEETTGVDLVALQLRLAAGEPWADLAGLRPSAPEGHALEARIYAEDSLRFLPSPGRLKVFRPPKMPGLRLETGYREGATVTPFYDPMIAQVVVKAPDRASALRQMDEALAAFVVEGVKTNIGFARAMLRHEPFVAGRLHTGLAEELIAQPAYKDELAALSS